MRGRSRSSKVLGAFALLSLQVACVKEISSNERLDRASPPLVRKPAPSPEQLRKLDCSGGEVLRRARNVNRPETERLTDYTRLMVALQKKIAIFDEAIKRNPDLKYAAQQSPLMTAHEACEQHVSEVRREFERYVRELVEVPTATELRGGEMVTVRRVDFQALRRAIDTLGPTDREALVSSLVSAEKRLDSAPPPPAPKKRRPSPSRRKRRR